MRDVYARKGLSQVPRLLSLEDRNPFSPTYGCCNREYWLCRATDFPSAIAQFGIHALALAWHHEMPGNLYYQQAKIRDWTVAGMTYWMSIQKNDGSFDEFYPNERGWAGPTGFLLYAMIDSYRLLGSSFPDEERDRFLSVCEKAARYLVKWDEPGVLANHHAMAVLPVFEAARLLGSAELWRGYEEKLKEFYTYCDPEGWCLEYDGTDPGYLSATVSFLGKIYKHRAEYPVVARDRKMREVLERAVEFCAWFAYPNGHYAGTAGSRQTLHFYPHGFELLAPELPLAGAVADAMLAGLQAGALVPPEIQEDRYFQYRVPEMLLSYVDYGARTYAAAPAERPPLPYEREDFARYFPNGKIFVKKSARQYVVVNLAKGGVVKQFDLTTRELTANDCGLVAELEDGRLLTSQWIGKDYATNVEGDGLTVSGACHRVPTKLFTPIKFILFRLFILSIGWNTWLAYQAKGLIRRLLMTHAASEPVRFVRKIKVGAAQVELEDTIELQGVRVRRLYLGDELPIRYVPQSRYFQPQELGVTGRLLSAEELETLNTTGRLTLTRAYALTA
jgi:hypothetical protein